jgi:Protein of unknown function (DUF3040)
MRLSRRERRILRQISKYIRATDPLLAAMLEDPGEEDKNGPYAPFVLF